MGDCVPAIAVKAFDEEGDCETTYFPMSKLNDRQEQNGSNNA